MYARLKEEKERKRRYEEEMRKMSEIYVTLKFCRYKDGKYKCDFIIKNLKGDILVDGVVWVSKDKGTFGYGDYTVQALPYSITDFCSLWSDGTLKCPCGTKHNVTSFKRAMELMLICAHKRSW